MSDTRTDASTFKSFTTESKRHVRKGHSPIRARCIEFVDSLLDDGYTRIPISDAVERFKLVTGIMNRSSVRDYFGSQASRSTRRIQQLSRYASGTVSFKTIELSQNVAYKKGYLEILGLVYYEKKGSALFLVVNDRPLIPQMSPPHREESAELFIHKISLSPINQELSKGKGSEGKPCGCPSNVETSERTLQNNNNIQGERNKLSLDSGG